MLYDNRPAAFLPTCHLGNGTSPVMYCTYLHTVSGTGRSELSCKCLYYLHTYQHPTKYMYIPTYIHTLPRYIPCWLPTAYCLLSTTQLTDQPVNHLTLKSLRLEVPCQGWLTTPTQSSAPLLLCNVATTTQSCGIVLYVYTNQSSNWSGVVEPLLSKGRLPGLMSNG